MAYTQYDDMEPGFFQNSLKKIALDEGYHLGYDEGSDTVKITNPTTNKIVAFQSGQGQEYGMGGLQDGYNTVSDIGKLESALSVDTPTEQRVTTQDGSGDEGKKAPQATNYFEKAANKVLSPYRGKADELLSGISSNITNTNKQPSEYQKQIDELIGMIKARTNVASTPYNPALDTSYQTYRTQMLKDADTASNNITAEYLGAQGGNFNSAAAQIAASAKNNLISKADAAMGTYEDRYNAKNQQDISNQYSMLDALSKLENMEYTRGRQDIQDKYSLVNALLGMDDKDYTRAYKEKQDYTNNTGYMPIDTSTIPADSPLRQYDDIKAEIQRRESINPNDPDIQVLKALRNEKIMKLKDTDPAAYEQYKGEIESVQGIPTLKLQEFQKDQAYKDALNKKAEIETKIKQAELDALPEKTQLEMQKLLAQAEEAATNAKYAPLESQAKLQQIYAQIDNITADNARADAEFKRKIDKDDNLNAMYQGMMASGDPAKWLEDYKDGLTPDEYKALSEVITKSATDKQKVAETERAAKNTDTLDSLKNKMLASGDKYEDYMAYVKRYGGYISPENIAELVKIASAFKPEKSSGVTYVPNNN